MSIQIDESKMVMCGTNVLGTEVENKLILVIDLTKTFGLSSSGKMTTIGNTGGFTSLPGNVKGNLYIGIGK